MKVLIVLSALAALACAGNIISPYAYTGLPAWGGYGYSGLGWNGWTGIAAPAVSTYTAAAPVVSTYAAAPVVPAVTKTQYHAQDELGQASYGYAHPGQAHNAVRDAFGNVAGSYSYVDPNGKIVKTDYIADGAGFRVASNALPVAPAVPIAPAVDLPVGPAPVQDTPEVVAARAAHLAEHAAAKSRSKRQILAYSGLPFTYGGLYGHGLAYNTLPVASTYAAAVPATRAATLTTVVNTPGHAVSYRVD